ncbi:Long polar fimbria protein A [Enterobacter cancerogenus]|uniref:Long polar fimbria protein A n=1 Tax=Enterobacter cancerogenus TaxID=69218 RepID=A0A484X1Y0_9ENTR|nr:Long polar fimbria protein A [Enterobacter cancerogenus]
MNKIALGLFVASVVGCSASAFAATDGEGQINFTGEIIDSACQVVNGLSNPLNVTLGKVSKRSLPVQAPPAPPRNLILS